MKKDIGMLPLILQLLSGQIENVENVQTVEIVESIIFIQNGIKRIEK